MKILIAPDKFKGSLSAQAVCEAIGKGLKKKGKSIHLIYHPMADGGDGSIDILSRHLNLQPHKVKTLDPLGRKITAQYYTSADAAFIEVANASGLVLLTAEERNPMLTSTLGTGLMIKEALGKGYQNIFLFLGGSATNDAGMGIAAALGYQFLDKHKNELPPIGENLSKVKFIHSSPLFDFKKIKITLLCDVQNPLFGTSGSAFVYAPQKGATAAQVLLLDEGLRQFSHRLKLLSGLEISHLPGTGAAGGIGASLVTLLGAKIENGFSAIARITGLEKQIEKADWVICGEGKLDHQSLQGKVISGVAEFCKKHNKPLALFVGKNTLLPSDIQPLKTKSIFSISKKAKNLNDAMSNGAIYLTELAEQFQKILNKNP